MGLTLIYVVLFNWIEFSPQSLASSRFYGGGIYQKPVG